LDSSSHIIDVNGPRINSWFALEAAGKAEIPAVMTPFFAVHPQTPIPAPTPQMPIISSLSLGPVAPLELDNTMINNVFSGIDVVIANGKKSELSRLRRKIELSGGTVRLNFSKAIRYYVVPYGKQTGSKWKDGQARLFGLEPIDERFVDACIHYKQLLPHLPFRARYASNSVSNTHQFIMYNPADDFTEHVRPMEDDDMDSETTTSITSPKRRKRYDGNYGEEDSCDD